MARPRELMRELLVAEAVRLVGGEAESLLPASLVDLEVALADVDVTVSFEGDDVRRQPVEEPAIVGNHHGAAREFEKRVFQRRQGLNIKVVVGSSSRIDEEVDRDAWHGDRASLDAARLA